MSNDGMTQRVEDRYWLATVDDEGVRLRAGEEKARAEFRAWLAEHDAKVRAQEREKCARIAERSAAARFLAWEIGDRIRANRKEQGS